MNRRDFVNKSGIALLATALAELSPDIALPMAEAQENAKPSGARNTFQLTKKSNPEAVKAAYEISAMSLGASAPPYVYAFYDEEAKKFISPLEVKATLKKGSYTMQPTLHSFNIREADQANFKNLKNQVQLSFNATAPITKSDQLTWVFMNAVDIFLAKDQNGRQDQLTKFTNSSGKNATPLDSTPKISVPNGTVSLQVTAFGQKQEGFWTKFFDFLTKAVNSPIVSTASKGFGIPGLAPQALTFVDGVLNVIAQQNRLVSLWKTGSLEFAITDDAIARFKMKPGLWATIDSDYAQRSNFLEGHSVDLLYQSFRITDKTARPIDANYLVADMQFSS